MFARVTTAQCPPDKLEEIAHRILTPSLEAVKRSPGFKDALSFVDTATGKIVMNTVWETEAAMQASDALRKEVLGQAASLGLVVVSTEVYNTVTRS
ncbi:MAG TPA: hypothetical protein VF808_16190 [Ktedonobacterales bacterium]